MTQKRIARSLDPNERTRSAHVEHREGPVAESQRRIGRSARPSTRHGPLPAKPSAPGLPARHVYISVLCQASLGCPHLHGSPTPSSISTPTYARSGSLPRAQMRQLLDLAAQLYAEPLDRTRPLWRFVVIGGLEGDRAAIWTIIHHSVSDGIGQLRMAELYQQIRRDEAPPADVDLDAVIAEAVSSAKAKAVGGDLTTNAVSSIRASASHLARPQFWYRSSPTRRGSHVASRPKPGRRHSRCCRRYVPECCDTTTPRLTKRPR